jgi:hypothetical protein
MPHRRKLAPTLMTPLLGALLALAMLLPTAPTGPTATIEPGLELRASKSVRVAYYAGPYTMQRLLDRCDGPVAVKFEGLRQRLLAQHDYCGGRWILGLERGDTVTLSNGNLAGRYRVNGNIKVVRKGTSAGVLRGMGNVVAQTCRPDGDTVRLVGLSRLS